MLNEYRYYIPSNNHNIKFGLRNKELDSETFIRCIYLQFSGDSALKRVLFCYKKKVYLYTIYVVNTDGIQRNNTRVLKCDFSSKRLNIVRNSVRISVRNLSDLTDRNVCILNRRLFTRTRTGSKTRRFQVSARLRFFTFVNR